MKYSFVIPCYYSEKSVSGVVDEIYEAFPVNKYDIEIILVNDGSTDGTRDVIFGLADEHPEVLSLNLAKNVGQDGAVLAGFSRCTGDYIIVLDDDGQNPPMEAHKLIEKLDEGYDIVWGKYHEKKHSAMRRFESKVNDFMARILIDKPKDIYLCGYFAIRKYVKDEISNYKGPFPYMRGLLLRTTTNYTNVYIEHRNREIGQSTYTFGKLLKLWFNGFTSFSIKPLRISTFTGCIVALIGFVMILFVIIKTLAFGVDARGWASSMSVILFLGGIQLIMIGLVGEYVGRMFLSANNSPQYTIRETSEERIEKK